MSELHRFRWDCPANESNGVIPLHKVLVVVNNPEVYKSPHTDCYIVFGEAKVCFTLFTSCGPVVEV